MRKRLDSDSATFSHLATKLGASSHVAGSAFFDVPPSGRFAAPRKRPFSRRPSRQCDAVGGYAALGILIAVAVTIAPWAGAELEDTLRGDLVAALEELGEVEDAERAGFIIGHMDAEQITEEEWRELLTDFTQTHPFSPNYARFWHYAAEELRGPRQYLAVGLAATSAADTMARTLTAEPPEGSMVSFGPYQVAAGWLQDRAGRLAPPERAGVFATLKEAVSQPGAMATIPVRRQVEMALTLAAHHPFEPGGRGAVSEALGLAGPIRTMWERFGVFLIGDSALNLAQMDSLGHVLASFPEGLHDIGAIIVPEGSRIDPMSPDITTPRQLVFVPPIPLERVADPIEFIRELEGPPVPEFTIVAAQAIVRAIQAVQFARRPELVARRDFILLRAGRDKYRYFRQDIRPQVYVDNPDALLPAVAYLWIIDSGRAFQLAVDLFNLPLREPLDSVLLLADTLSGGAPAAPAFTIRPDGSIVSGPVPLVRTRVSGSLLNDIDLPATRRRPLPSDVLVVNGMNINGRLFDFEITDAGAAWKLER